jgi:predicted transcriptional regulator of viral defense system
MIARVAAHQHGVITHAQLIGCGISKSAISRRASIGALHRVHRGVYAVGHLSLGDRGRWMAAILACGEAAVLSHRSAAELWRLLPTQPGLVDVTMPTRAGRKCRNGIRIHRPAGVDRTERVVLDRIPVTTVARTLRDLSRVLSERELRKAIRAAEIAGRPVGDYARLTKGTMSDLELEFLALCRRHRLPKPEVSVWSAGIGSTSSGARSG